MSMSLSVVPQAWKGSKIISMAKIKCPQNCNDFRPIALTCVASKCFERLVIKIMKQHFNVFKDPLQFAYSSNGSTVDIRYGNHSFIFRSGVCLLCIFLTYALFYFSWSE